jgi:formate dehydrogenase accessory protein FdhD
MMPPLQSVDALRLAGGHADAMRETLAEETPIALLYNGVPHVVMMATPADLVDFAVGFSLTEGIVAAASDIEIVDMLPRERGLALHLAIPSACFEALQRRRRTLVGRSGCGLCGAEALEAAVRPVRRVAVAVAANVSRAGLSAAFVRLAAAQPLNRECGALHAAAAMLGAEILVREDVGRHNALDKVVGALARGGLRADALLVTSRASYELAHKAAEAGVPVLAAVSAPTAYAVRLAREAGLTLVAFAREDRMTVYTGTLREDARFPPARE